MSTLRWYLVKDAERRREFTLTGSVTEKADFVQLLEYLVDQNVLDLAGVTNINSSGARDLMRFLRGAQTESRELVLCRCSPSFVNQLNMISSFAGSAKVDSVMAPFACEECEATDTVCVALDEDPVAQVADSRECKACGGELVFDDIEEHYFGFLRRGAP